MAKGDKGLAPALGERIQIGVKMEKRMVKVLKAVAEYHDISLGELLEGIVLHAFDHSLPFDQETIQRITQLKKVYAMDYDIEAAPRMKVSDTTQPKLMR